MSKPSSSASRTVFVRFVPPSSNIRRHHLEDLFSQIGPIKKSSVIVPPIKRDGSKEEPGNASAAVSSSSASSYGFVKYVTEDDAHKAAQKFDRSMLRISADEKIQLRVEHASNVANNNKRKKTHKNDEKETNNSEEDQEVSHKRTSRIIIRNLSFYAKESHIRKALEEFGPIEEIHLPTVSEKQETKAKTFHRGFAFVTFYNPKDAQKCLDAKDIEIYKRKVQVAKALHKAGYEKLKINDSNNKKGSAKKVDSKEDQNLKTVENESSEDDDDDDDDDESSENSDSDDSDKVEEVDGKGDDDSESSNDLESEEESGDDQSDESKNDDDDDHHEGEKKEIEKDIAAVSEKRSLFLRNLPFDATRHDIFEAFRKFGRVSGIFIVKDKESGLPRGTAFLSYETQGATHRALAAAGSDNFASQRNVTEGKDGVQNTSEAPTQDDGGIMLRGRRIFVNLAVDKDTASTLTLDKQADRGKAVGKDRRNIYLKGEGRVDNEDENALWDKLPEQDKLKRQKAWSEKNTKLKSPLFFISPTRLSLRNLAKDVDERSLKKLCVMAVQRGLQKKLVTAEDQIAHWRAAGEMTTREIIQKLDEYENKEQVIPEFDDKNIRKFLPSVVVERDFTSNKKDGAPSRGFGFVEFLHHTHALACLRELNNNITYTGEYVNGGRQAMAQKGRRVNKKKRSSGEETEVKIPRLIVEFSVENRAKAKKQAEHKAQQKANTIKQKIENKGKPGTEEEEKRKAKKKSRGARQRERKRAQKDASPDDGHDETKENGPSSLKKAKISAEDAAESHFASNRKAPKAVKPSKKRKVDVAEENLSKLVDSYEKSLVPSSSKGDTDGKKEKRSKPEKRWFED